MGHVDVMERLVQGTWVTVLGFGVQISQRADGQLVCKEKELPCALCPYVLHTIIDALPKQGLVVIWGALRNPLQGKRL